MSYNIPIAFATIDSTGKLILASQSSSDYTGISAPSLSASGHGKIYFDSSLSIFKVSQNGSAYVPMLSSLTIPNILVNGGFERWSLATSNSSSSLTTLQFTDGWFMEKYDSTGTSFTQETTITDSSPSSLKYQAQNSSGFIFQPIANFADYAGKTVSFSVRYRPNVTNGAGDAIACGIWDGVNLSFGNALDNSTTAWRTSSGSATVASNPTCLYFLIAGNTGAGSLEGLTLFGFPFNSPLYFDNSILVEGSTLPTSYEPDNGRTSNITPVMLGSDQLLGSLTLQQLATPGTPTVVSSVPGSTSYSYKVVAVLLDGSTTPASAAGTIANGNALLSTGSNLVTWTPVPGAVYYRLYRTASGGTPSSTGLIASPGAAYWRDGGNAGDATTPPTINTTAQIHAYVSEYTGMSAPSLSASGHGTIYFDSGSNTFQASLNGGAYTTFGAGTPSGSTGDVQFNNAGAFGSDDTNFFWNNTSKRLGITTNTPQVAFDVSTSGTAAASTFRIWQQASANVVNGSIKGSAGATDVEITCNSGNLILENGAGTQTILQLANSSNTGLELNDTGTFHTNPGATVLFQMDSTTRGFLAPRLTTTQRNAISSPAEGLLVYDTTLHDGFIYNGTRWSSVAQNTVVTIAGAAPITPDASLANTIIVTVGVVTTINGPTNPYDGQKLTFRLVQDATGHTVTFNTGSGNFRFGTDLPSFTASGANLTDYVGVVYNSAATRWDIISAIQGF